MARLQSQLSVRRNLDRVLPPSRSRGPDPSGRSIRLRPGNRPAKPIVVAGLSDSVLGPIDERTPPWPGRRAFAGGAQVYVRHSPSTAPDGGEPALFVHGLAGSSNNWTDLQGALNPWLDSEAIDLPGFGRSGPARRDDYSIPAFANTVIDYLQRSGRAPVHLFGNSMGGAICIQVAARRPDLIRTLTLISPAVSDLRLSGPDNNAVALLLLIPGVRGAAERRMAAITPAQTAKDLIDVCFANPSLVPANRMAEAVAEARERVHLPWAQEALIRSVRGLIANYVSPGRWSAWHRMAEISAPTLVVWGDRDKLVNVALAARVARSIADARLLVLPGIGHTAQLEDVRSTARAFVSLLENLRPAKPAAPRSPGTRG
jgi:pimeloyl-ACP methyl ester carboxylesterase